MAFDKPSNRLYCKRQGTGGDYCVAVCDGKLILSLPDDNEPTQFWYKDETDTAGFMLRNKTSGKVVKYFGVGDQLELVNKPSEGDQSVLWTDSDPITTDGYIFIRTSSNVGVVMDAYQGYIAEGTKVTIHQNTDTDNDYWKLVPYWPLTYRILCKKRDEQFGEYCVSVFQENLILRNVDDDNITQLWYKDTYEGGFMLVNKATGRVARYSDVGVQLRLVRNPSISDKSVLWTASEDQGDGYTFISTTNDDGVVMDASQGYIRDGTIVSINSNVGTETEYWKLSRYGSPYRRLFCRASGRDGFYCVGIQDGKLILTRPVDGDRTQLWCKDSYEIGFVLVHVDTSKLVRYKGVQEQLELVNKPSCLDQSLLWTPSKRDDGILIRTLNNDNVVMDVAKGGIVEGVPVIIGQQSYSMSQTWFFSM